MLLYAIVSGHVQGVGFRYFVRTVAIDLGLSGWVRNLPDGRVEVEAEGDEDSLHELEQRLWKGSHFSRVENVNCSWTESVKGFEDFAIRR